MFIPESIGSKDVFAHAGLLLAGSEQIIVGTGIANIYARDPMAMANGAKAARGSYCAKAGLAARSSPAASMSRAAPRQNRMMGRSMLETISLTWQACPCIGASAAQNI